nr:sigmaY antisigma factor component [Fictibacillus solisalsi]
MTSEFHGLPFWLLVLLILVLLCQSIFLFLDGRKRGYRYWFWSLWGLIQCPLPLLFYLIFARKIFRRTFFKG